MFIGPFVVKRGKEQLSGTFMAESFVGFQSTLRDC